MRKRRVVKSYIFNELAKNRENQIKSANDDFKMWKNTAAEMTLKCPVSRWIAFSSAGLSNQSFMISVIAVRKSDICCAAKNRICQASRREIIWLFRVFPSRRFFSIVPVNWNVTQIHLFAVRWTCVVILFRKCLFNAKYCANTEYIVYKITSCLQNTASTILQKNTNDVFFVFSNITIRYKKKT